MKVSNEEELGNALKDDQDTIEIEGDLKKKVIRIKATGKVAWVIALGVVAVGIYALKSKKPAAPIVATGAVAILGYRATVAAISIAVAGGGVTVLTKLRNYNLTENGDVVILTKK